MLAPDQGVEHEGMLLPTVLSRLSYPPASPPTDKETEAHKGKVTCPKPLRKYAVIPRV